jgi:hypothetical protein
VNQALKERLNNVNRKLESEQFLASSGVGNELAFYIFDYPPECELEIRHFVDHSLHYLAKKNIKVSHVNLFDMVIKYLEKRKLLNLVLKKDRLKSDGEILKALQAPLHEQKLAKAFVEMADPTNHQLVLMTGIGTSWPLVRSHTLLNALHPVMGGTPLVIFFPGRYDTMYLTLFGKLDRRYYRAFPLMPS